MNRQTKYRFLMWTSSHCLVFSLLLQPAWAESIKIVVPNPLDSVEGEESLDVSNFGSFRQQQLYLASELASLPATHRTITGFYSRPDYTVTLPSTASYDDLVIKVSSTPASGLGSVFSDNYDAEEVTTVFDGALTISTQATGDPQGPRGFDYYFPFGTPYTYDPGAGNLLVELASSLGPAGSLILDGFSGAPAGIVSANRADATTGSVRSGGFVNQFEFVQVSPGDFNLDLAVSQADLDLVLLNWGGTSPPAPAGWVHQVPDGMIGQESLDNVLLNWGHGTAPVGAVPEPGTLLLGCIGLAVVGVFSRGK